MAIPFLTLASIAAPIIGSIISGKQQQKQQERAIKQVQDMAPPTLTYKEANQQAQDLLNPLYNEQLQNNLKQVDQHNIARGFYGQMPGDVFRRSTASEVERARAGQIASLTQQMMGQSQQQALQQQQLAMQYALGQGQQRQSNLGNLLNTGINTMFGYHDRTGQFPWEKGVASGLGSNTSGLNNKRLLELLSQSNMGLQASPMTANSGFNFGSAPTDQYKLKLNDQYVKPWQI